MAKEKKYNPLFDAGYVPRDPDTGKPHLSTINPAALSGEFSRKNTSYFLWKAKWTGITLASAILFGNIFHDGFREATFDFAKSLGSAVKKKGTASLTELDTKISAYSATLPSISDRSNGNVQTITLKPNAETEQRKAPSLSLVPKKNTVTIPQEEFDANYNARNIIQSCIAARDFYNTVNGQNIDIPRSSFPDDALFCLENGAQNKQLQSCQLSFNLLHRRDVTGGTIPQHTIRKVGRCAGAQLS